MNKKISLTVKKSLIFLSVLLFICALAVFSLVMAPSATGQNGITAAQAAGSAGTYTDNGNGLVLGTTSIRTTAANANNNLQNLTGTFQGADLYSSASISYNSSDTILTYTPAAGGEIRSKIMFLDTSASGLYQAIYDPSSIFAVSAALSLNMSAVDEGTSTNVTVTLQWVANGTINTNSQTINVNENGSAISGLKISNLSNNSNDTSAYFYIVIKSASAVKVRLSNITVSTEAVLSESISLSDTTNVTISGKNRADYSVDTKNLTTAAYANSFKNTYVKLGDTITLRTSIYNNNNVSTSYQLPSYYATVFNSSDYDATGKYGVYWQSYSSYLKDNIEVIDSQTAQYLTVLDRDEDENVLSGYVTIDGVSYYQITYEVSGNVQNAYEVIVAPKLLTYYGDVGPTNERGTSLIEQSAVRVKVDNTKPETPAISTSSSLGAAIANEAWFTDTNSITLTLNETGATQSVEYVYAFVIPDSGLIGIDVSAYDFTPFTSSSTPGTTFNYTDSQGLTKTSGARQQITFYKDNNGNYQKNTDKAVTFPVGEQGLVLVRVDAAGNVSNTNIYCASNKNVVKVDNSNYSLNVAFSIGQDDNNEFATTLNNNKSSAAKVDFIYGGSTHTADGVFNGTDNYGYASNYEAMLKRDQWVTIRLSVSDSQAKAYKLVRCKNDELSINNNNIVLTDGGSRSDYIDVTFKLTDDFIESNRIIMFYFRKCVDELNVNETSFTFTGNALGVDDYIEALEDGEVLSGLQFNTKYYQVYSYNVYPAYSGNTMLASGTILMNGTSYAYTGMLTAGGKIVVNNVTYTCIKRTLTQTGVYLAELYNGASYNSVGFRNVGEYYYTIEIDSSSTTVYFGEKGGVYNVTKAASAKENEFAAKNTLTYGAEFNGKKGLDLLEFTSLDSQGNVIDTAEFTINGISYYYASSGVLGSYTILDPVSTSLSYTSPDVNQALRILIRFTPIALNNAEVFSQSVIAANISLLGQYYNLVNGVYVLKDTALYHGGNFSAYEQYVTVQIINADGEITIEGLENNTLELVYDGSYKSGEIVFTTSPEADLPVSYLYTLLNEDGSIYYDGEGKTVTYDRINNAGKYMVTYSLVANKCNYKSEEYTSYITIAKRELILTAQDAAGCTAMVCDEGTFDTNYIIKFGKITSATLPKPLAETADGTSLSVAYTYAFRQVLDYSGTATPGTVYSEDYAAAAFPSDLGVGTYVLSINVSNANNKGHIYVLFVVSSVVKSEIIKAEPALNSTYAVYNKDETLQSYLSDDTQGHLEFGQTLAEMIDVILANVSTSATYRIAGVNTTINGRFVFETEGEIIARYAATYPTDTSKHIAVVRNSNGELILPVRYDASSANIVASYSVQLKWEAGEYVSGEFVRNHNFDTAIYDTAICVARATANFANVSFETITYGETLENSALIGTPTSSASGSAGLPAAAYTISYDNYKTHIYSKGMHNIPCTFTPAQDYLNNYRKLSSVNIPLEVIAKQAYIEFDDGVASLTYGASFANPVCSVYYMDDNNVKTYLSDVSGILQYVYTNSVGQTVNMSSVLNTTTYVSALPGTYKLVITITSNDYMGDLTISDFVVRKGTLSLMTAPTQAIVEYGVIIKDIAFYNGQCQNVYTREAYSGHFELQAQAGDDTFIPNASNGVDSVVRTIKFVADNTDLYNFYEEYSYNWTYTVNKNSKDVSIVADADDLRAVYDGNAKNVDFTITYPGDDNSVIKASTTVTYKSQDGQVEYTSVPSDAGTYMVVITVDESFPNYTGSETATLVIEPKTIDINVEGRKVSYTGSKQGFGDVDFEGYGDVDYTITYYTYLNVLLYSEPSEVGRYIARITVNENNYSGTDDVEFCIIPSLVEVSGWAAVYSGAANEISVRVLPSIVDYTVSYRLEQTDDEGNLVGTFGSAAPITAGRYQVSIVIDENGYHNEITSFAVAQASGGYIYDAANELKIIETNQAYFDVVADDYAAADVCPLFMRVTKAVAGVTLSQANQNKTVTYTASSFAVVATFDPNRISATYTYTPYEFEVKDGAVSPIYGSDNRLIPADASKVAYDSYGRPSSVGYYLVTIDIDDNNYTIGEYTAPILVINPATLTISTTPTVDGNIIYKQSSDDVRFAAGSGIVRFVSAGTAVSGYWKLIDDISAYSVGTYSGVGVRFIPTTASGEVNRDFISPSTTVAITIAKRNIGEYIYFTDNGVVLPWEQNVNISREYTQLAITASAWVNLVAAGIDAATYNNGNGLTLKIKYNNSYTAPVDVGVYSIVAEISDANYEGASLTGKLTIVKAQPAIETPTISEINVNDTLSQATISSGLAYIAGSVGESTLRSIAGEFSFRYPDTVMSVANYQTVWMVFTPADLNTYAIVNFQAQIFVRGLSVDVADVKATSITYGQPLKDSVLSYSSSSVAGTIKWVDGNAVVNVGDKAAYTFIPYDTATYNIITGEVNIDIKKADMTYDADTLLIKGYVGETIGDAVDNVVIDLTHSLYPNLKVEGATFVIGNIDLTTVIGASKEVWDCSLKVMHPNYNDIEISATIRTFISLSNSNFYIGSTSKEYDSEAVGIEDFDIDMVGTDERLAYDAFEVTVMQNGVRVDEIREPGVYTVVISVFDDVDDEEISMAYDGECTFTYTVKKCVIDEESDKRIYLTGATSTYGNTAGEIVAYYPSKTYGAIINATSKTYDGKAATIADFMISAADEANFVITGIKYFNQSTNAYVDVASITMTGNYKVTLSLARNVINGVQAADNASYTFNFSVLPAANSAPSNGSGRRANVSFDITLYAAANATEVKFTYFSKDKSVVYTNAPTSAGEYSVVVTFLATNVYYEGSQEFDYEVLPMTIYAALNASYSFKYGSNISITPMFTASVGTSVSMSGIDYSLEYYVSVNGAWTRINYVPVNAGTYKVQVVVNNNDYVLAENYGTARVTISQLGVTISTVPTLSTIYYGQELYNSIIFNGVAELDDTAVVIDGTFSFETPNLNTLTAGLHGVSVVFTPTNANYETVVFQTEIRVLKASASIEAVTLSLPYNAMEQLPIVRTTPVTNLAITYSFYQMVNGQRQGVNVPIAAGVYEVDMVINDGNYEGTATMAFIITKGAIGDGDVVAPTASNVTYGQSLSYGAFEGGSVTNPATGTLVSGSFVFSTPALTLLGQTVAISGTTTSSNPYGFVPYAAADGEISNKIGTYYSIPYKFVPSDTANYETYESTITVTLMKAAATISVYSPVTGIYGNIVTYTYGDVIGELDFKTSPLGLVVSNTAFMASESEGGLFNTTPDAGTYTFTAQINDTNYTGSLTYVVSILKREVSVSYYDEYGISTTWYTYTYGAAPSATAHIITSTLVTQDAQNVSEIEKNLSYRYYRRDSSSGTLYRTVPDGIGEYVAYAVLENSNYYIDETKAVINYDINKATVESISFDSLNMYYGSVAVPTVITRPSNVQYTISYPGYDSMPTTAGSHRIKVVITDDNYYSTEKTSIFYIYQKEISIDNISVTDKVYDGTDTIAINGRLSGLMLDDEVYLKMTAHTKDGATAPGMYKVEILTWEIYGLDADNYSLVTPVYNGTVKISQKIVTDPKTGSYMTSDSGFSANVTVDFSEVYSAQNGTNLFSAMLGQTAVVQTITIKELGLRTVLDKKVKFYVLIPEKYRDSSTLEIEMLGDLADQSISPVREGDYYTFYADRSGEIVFYTHDFPYWVVIVGGILLMIIIGLIVVFIFSPVRRRKRLDKKIADAYGMSSDGTQRMKEYKKMQETRRRRSNFGR